MLYTKLKNYYAFMNFLNCPHCNKQALSFRHLMWPPFSLFWLDSYKKCIRCSGPVKIDMNGLMTCSIIFFLFLFILGILLSFIDTNILKQENPISYEPSYLFELLLEAIPVIFGIWISFEIPAKYFNKRLFKKRDKSWVG